MREPFDTKWLSRKFGGSRLVESTRLVRDDRTFLLFGYFCEGNESADESRAVAAVWESTTIPMSSRSSTLWRAAEIDAVRKDDWVMFTRDQQDLSEEGLKDFGNDCFYYLNHLLEEARKFAVPE